MISTAGVSPVQAPAEAVLAVDLYGTAVVLEEFGAVIAPGGAGVHISSMAGHMPPPLDPETEHALAFTPVEELLALPVLAPDARAELRRRLRHLQARPTTCASRPQPSPGATAAPGSTAISPGIILTPLARDEMSGPGAEGYRKMIEVSAAGRVGTADEVAAAAAFLLGPDAGFITGTDLLIDGGVIAALRAGRWQLAL